MFRSPKTLTLVLFSSLLIAACKGGQMSMSNFGYASVLTESLLLGNLALRVGKKIEWDAQDMRVKDMPQADQFIHMLQGEAAKAGVEIRGYTARPSNTKEFYTEVPFEMDVDGQFYSVLHFFERVKKLERIINISNERTGVGWRANFCNA